MKNIKQHIKDLPKADVHSHLHLAGSQKRFRERYPNANINFPKSYNGLGGMIDFIYGHLNTVMLTNTDVVNFMEIAIESAIEDNVTLLEASVDIGLAKFFDDTIDNVIEVVRVLKEKYKHQINFRPDLGVNKDLDLEKVYSDGVKCIESNIFNGIDLYGKEADQDLKPFLKLYDIAKGNGLKTKVHIGEFSDYHSIDNAIKLLQPQEIQHGVRATDSKKTMDLILENNIRLNLCPTSNIALEAISDLNNYPIRTLFDYGIKLTINTDDLILFNATVTDEFVNLLEQNIFSLEELNEIRINAFD